MDITTAEPRPLHVIAAEIRQTWPKVNFGAVPYLEAMEQLTTVTDMYYTESGRTMVLYFLSNSGSWRGEDAKRIKNELRVMVGQKPTR
jgi:hypothetical protein